MDGKLFGDRFDPCCKNSTGATSRHDPNVMIRVERYPKHNPTGMIMLTRYSEHDPPDMILQKRRPEHNPPGMLILIGTTCLIHRNRSATILTFFFCDASWLGSG